MVKKDRTKITIIANENPSEVDRWIAACHKMNDKVDFQVVNITRNNWLEETVMSKPQILLTKPGGLTAPFKQLYDERLTILVKDLGYLCFPSLDEVLIYENKRYFSYWLKANKIPHPKTDVFYFKEEAIDFLTRAVFPIVGKTNIGASGSGVRVLHNRKEAVVYIHNTFSFKGAAKRSGPNLKKGGLFRRGVRYLINPSKIAGKLKVYKSRSADVQNSFVVLQEYIQHEFEWRVVRIGESFFAHKKLKMGEKTSGSLLKNYDNPPLSILDFVKEITDRFGFVSQAVDIFETEQGYLVNEMQCIFGQSDPYQMLVDGVPGRYTHQNNNWVFEAGDFNTNESYDLRLSAALELL